MDRCEWCGKLWVEGAPNCGCEEAYLDHYGLNRPAPKTIRCYQCNRFRSVTGSRKKELGAICALCLKKNEEELDAEYAAHSASEEELKRDSLDPKIVEHDKRRDEREARQSEEQKDQKRIMGLECPFCGKLIDESTDHAACIDQELEINRQVTLLQIEKWREKNRAIRDSQTVRGKRVPFDQLYTFLCSCGRGGYADLTYLLCIQCGDDLIRNRPGIRIDIPALTDVGLDLPDPELLDENLTIADDVALEEWKRKRAQN